MERIRNGRIVFAGDSIGRNHWESLVCLLARAVGNQSSIYEENGNPITKHKGYLSIRFSGHNLTVEYYRTPFLVTVGRPPADSPPGVRKTVRVDRLHWRSRQWVGADLLVFNAGHWWNRDKIFKMGHVNTTMDVREAFRRSLQTWKRWVLRKVDQRRSYVFFRSFSPVHYSGGTWDKGGHCNLSKVPDTNLTATEQPEPWTNRAILKAVEQVGAGNGRATFLNITYLTWLRKDGHPSNHREPGTPVPFPQDCSHWCLPGVPDAWNELLYAHLLLMGRQ
ncbi:unnamed protein product [Spirodela intermedia]|uniref:Trichome birefringence-like C-terminal domain-containing protein n=1 Tax=Spirodela intermedia TaxID=51605 RepID=A0A7I8JBM8_SPIIN|nr:unnamed protein product [Spirodela intermedia]CAA6667606.1 unnamed protein product [Spirodela intermedia]